MVCYNKASSSQTIVNKSRLILVSTWTLDLMVLSVVYTTPICSNVHRCHWTNIPLNHGVYPTICEIPELLFVHDVFA